MKDRIIRAIDPITDKRWGDFITKHPEGTIFHHPAWARVLLERYGASLAYYVLEDEHGEIVAAAPFVRVKNLLLGQRLVCLPCSEYCFPLAYCQEDLDELLMGVVDRLNEGGFSYMEVRGWGELGDPTRLGLKKYPCYLTHTVDLKNGLEGIRARMDRNGRYNLRYAQKSPITIRLGQAEDDLREFHRLTTVTRRRLNLLPWPYQFIRSIYQHVIIPGHGYLLLAMIDSRVVAANMYFCFKDTVTHKFNAADEKYLNYRPNYLLIWDAMERACQESYRYYYFGVTNPENTNLADFKRHWGSVETTLPYYYYPEVQGLSSVRQSSLLYRSYNTVNKYMPVFSLKLAASVLHNRLG